jgi:hypothetical protein
VDGLSTCSGEIANSSRSTPYFRLSFILLQLMTPRNSMVNTCPRSRGKVRTAYFSLRLNSDRIVRTQTRYSTTWRISILEQVLQGARSLTTIIQEYTSNQTQVSLAIFPSYITHLSFLPSRTSTTAVSHPTTRTTSKITHPG